MKEVITIKNKLYSIVFLCIVLCIFTSNIQATTPYENKILNWYLKYGNKGEYPQTPDMGDYTDKYNVISLDRSGNKTIYLTFDAGYENGNIAKVLEVLNKQDVPAAFFVLPNLIKTNPELLNKMNNDGHLICNHTKSHGNMGKITDISVFKKELEDNEKILKETLGIEMSKYYRPPEGAFSELNLLHAKELGYKTVFWSLAYADWDNNKQQAPEKALNLLLSRIHPGCVLLLHPTSSTNSIILDELITTIKKDGYIFKSLDEFPIK